MLGTTLKKSVSCAVQNLQLNENQTPLAISHITAQQITLQTDENLGHTVRNSSQKSKVSLTRASLDSLEVVLREHSLPESVVLLHRFTEPAQSKWPLPSFLQKFSLCVFNYGASTDNIRGMFACSKYHVRLHEWPFSAQQLFLKSCPFCNTDLHLAQV